MPSLLISQALGSSPVPKRTKNRFLRWEFIPGNPLSYRERFLARYFRPLQEAFCNPINFYVDRLSRVIGLGFRISPPAIFWCVVPVYINPINRKSGRAFSHIRDKVFKTFSASPSFANRNTTTAVIMELWMILVVAPRSQTSPNMVHGVVRVVRSSSVASTRNSSRFSLQTTARFCMSFFDALRNYFNLVSTIANTVPVRTTSLI